MQGPSKTKNGQASKTELELKLFDVMLELCHNIACDFPTLIFSEGYAAHILSMTACLHQQLEFNHWLHIVENLKVLSEALRSCETKSIDPFFDFLLQFGGSVCSLFKRLKETEDAELEQQLKIKSSFVRCFSNVFSDLGDSHISQLENISFNLDIYIAEILDDNFATTENSAREQKSIIEACLKILGELSQAGTEFTSRLVSERLDLRLLPNLQSIVFNSR